MKKFTVTVQKPLPEGRIGRRPVPGYKFFDACTRAEAQVKANWLEGNDVGYKMHGVYPRARGNKAKIVRRRSVVSSRTSPTGQLIRDWQYDVWTKK